MKRAPPIGRLRGKTRAGRLRLWDTLLVRLFADAVPAGVLEVGVGERPDTLLELADVLGCAPTAVELHPRRVAAARAATPFCIVQADALVPPNDARRYGVVRCANVLRQYPAAQVARAHAALVGRTRVGGVVLEGSCDAGGDVGSFHVLRHGPGGPIRTGLVFFSSFARGFAPIQLRDWLPCDLRREVRPGGVMTDLFAKWTRAWKQVRQGVPATDFRLAAEAMGEPGRCIDLSEVHPGASAWWWTPERGVPRAD